MLHVSLCSGVRCDPPANPFLSKPISEPPAKKMPSLGRTCFQISNLPIFGDELVTSFVQIVPYNPHFLLEGFWHTRGHTINAGYGLTRHLESKRKLFEHVYNFT